MYIISFRGIVNKFIVKPMCYIKKTPNTNCVCVYECIYRAPFKNVISYTKLKCLPIHSPSSVECKTVHRK